MGGIVAGLKDGFNEIQRDFNEEKAPDAARTRQERLEALVAIIVAGLIANLAPLHLFQAHVTLVLAGPLDLRE